MKKYDITQEHIIHNGITLFRIRALKSFYNIQEGELGGYIQKESNLSQEGYCWIHADAKVYDNATVSGNAHIYEQAEVCKEAQVYGDAAIYGHALITDEAQVYENAHIYGKQNELTEQCCKISSHAHICGDASIWDSVLVTDYAIVKGHSFLYDHVIVQDNTILDNINAGSNTIISGQGSLSAANVAAPIAIRETQICLDSTDKAAIIANLTPGL